jgi:hypothetical protein
MEGDRGRGLAGRVIFGKEGGARNGVDIGSRKERGGACLPVLIPQSRTGVLVWRGRSCV